MLTSLSLCNSIRLLEGRSTEAVGEGKGGVLFIASTRRRRVILSLHIWAQEGVCVRALQSKRSHISLLVCMFVSDTLSPRERREGLKCKGGAESADT